MPQAKSAQLINPVNSSLPLCAADCLWYEEGTEDQPCENRNNFVCRLFRDEVFGNDEMT